MTANHKTVDNSLTFIGNTRRRVNQVEALDKVWLLLRHSCRHIQESRKFISFSILNSQLLKFAEDHGDILIKIENTT